MKVLFIGGVKFLLCALQELIAMQVNIVGVCTASHSPINSDHFDLSLIAHNAGNPVKLAPKINSADVVAWVESLNSDILCCFGWSQIIRKSL